MRPAADIRRRPETPADDAFCLALFRGTRPPGADLAGLEPALREMLLRQQHAGQAMSWRADHPAARREIVEADGTSVGRLVTERTAAALTIVDIALLPAWQGCGLGTRLLEAAMAEARAAGVPVRLRVVAGNEGAARLYRRLGFMAARTGETDVEMIWGGGDG